MRNGPALLVACLACACGGSGGTTTIAAPPHSDRITPVHEVQGAGSVSPLAGTRVIVAGVVTGDFQSNDSDIAADLGGFFLLEENPDSDPATSDGVFVFDGDTPAVDVVAGDRVTVAGEVVERSGETQIVADSVARIGKGPIRSSDIMLPLPVLVNSDGVAVADLERVEGMLVRFPQTLTVASIFDLERFGEISLVNGGRRFQFTNYNAPDVTDYAAHQEALAASLVILDDGSRQQNVQPIRFLFPDPVSRPTYAMRVGDSVPELVGNVRFSRSSGVSGLEAFRIVSSSSPAFLASNPRPAMPPAVGGELTVASFNVLNFFTTLDSGAPLCGPSGRSNCRGANNASEFVRQRAKILTALATLDADIVGLIEIENNVSASLASIVDGLNDRLGSAAWSYIDTGIVGSDAIRVGLIYRQTSVTPLGVPALLDQAVDARFLDGSNRPLLLHAFTQRSNGAVFSVAVAHLKSKGSSCAGIGDPDIGDGQGNCNATRTAAMAAIADWLGSDPTGSGDPDVLLIGDMNACVMEDPLREIASAGYTNLLGPAAWSFQYRGESGALDHAVVSPSLLTQVTGVTEWHINADESPAFDYNLDFGRDPSLFDAQTPFRASDHDPLLVGLSLNSD